MKYILTILLTFISLLSFSQTEEKILMKDDNSNKQLKHLIEHPHLTLKIDSIELGATKLKVNFKFKGEIKTQTGLMELNDSIGLNVIFLNLNILNKEEFFYSHTFYRKGKDGTWTEVYGIQFYSITPGGYTDGWGGIGYRGEANSFWYKMYLKFE